jgi:ribosomal-protein-alanine N-acetyltransferase
MIQAASTAHAAAMALMHRHTFPPAQAWESAAIAQQLGLPGSFGLISEAGFVLARALAGEAEILTLAVLPEARRQGIGRALLAAAMDDAAARGAASLFLEVCESNSAARALYEGFGAHEVGRRRAYYPNGGNALVLRIALSPPAALCGSTAS